jgi:hypothetical protein
VETWVWIVVGLGAVALACLAWGWFEAGWPRFRQLELEVPGLPAELEGMTIVHLSDFHLGVPSRGGRAVRLGVEWAEGRDADLIVLTGDLVSRPSGERRLRELMRKIPQSYAILGNHDLGISRDPFSKEVLLHELEPATLLLDEGTMLEVRGRSVWLAGFDPRSRGHEPDLAREADLRVVLSHFPTVLDRLPPGGWDVVLAGHMHDGQICIPYPGGKLRLAHPHARYTHGTYRRGGTVMHVSAGLGTTFVPFRFFARPEATELVLRPAS